MYKDEASCRQIEIVMALLVMPYIGILINSEHEFTVLRTLTEPAGFHVVGLIITHSLAQLFLKEHYLLLSGKYTSVCDVWSYGVLTWEIFAKGGTPYPGLSNSKAREKIDQGIKPPFS